MATKTETRAAKALAATGIRIGASRVGWRELVRPVQGRPSTSRRARLVAAARDGLGKPRRGP